MKRIITDLETRLLEGGFHLKNKVYEGKHSEKIKSYLYLKDMRACVYVVELDKTRNHIINYSFRNYSVHEYSKGILEGLEEVLTHLKTYLDSIYDFSTNEVREEPIYIQEYEVPFVEESYFDD